MYIWILAGMTMGQVAPATVGQSPNSTAFANRVYFAGQPTKADLEEYAKLGVKTVINLRAPAEMEKAGFDEAAAVKAAGMEYLNVPMSGEIPGDAELAKIYAALGVKEQKVLLHCASSNRAGTVWALFRGKQDKLPLEEAIAEGKAAGMKNPNLEKQARARLEEK